MKSPVTPEVSIIVPAYNEADVIQSVIKRACQTMDTLNRPYEVVVVDDASTDATAERAREAGAKVISHPYNIGNGAAIKTGIRNASGEILIMMDGDGQHAPEDIPRLLVKIGPYDMVVGARTKESETSLYRNIANSAFNWLATYVCGRRIEDLTSGFRAMKASVAREFIPLLPNTFSYPTTITLAAIRSGYSLVYIPIKTAQRVGKSKIKPLQDGSRFLLIIFKIATLYSPLKIFLPVSIITFLIGFVYGLYKVFFLDTRYGPTSAMLIAVSVLMFLIGLVSEQIAQLRLDRIETMKRGTNEK